MRVNGSEFEGVASAELKSIHVVLSGSPWVEYLGHVRVGEFPPGLKVVEVFPVDNWLVLGPSASLEMSGQAELRLSAANVRMSNGATVVAEGPITINEGYFACLANITSGGQLLINSGGVVTQDIIHPDLPGVLFSCGPGVLTAEHASIHMFHGPAEVTTNVKSIDASCDCNVTVVNRGDLEIRSGYSSVFYQTLSTENEKGDLRITGSISDTLGGAFRKFNAAGSLEVTSYLGSSGGWRGEFTFGDDFHFARSATFAPASIVVQSSATDTPSEILVLGTLYGPVDVRGGGGDHRIVWDPKEVVNLSERTVTNSKLNGGDGNDAYEVSWTDGVELQINDSGASHEQDELVFDALGEFVVDTGSELIGQNKTFVSYSGIESVTIIGNPQIRRGDFDADGRTNSKDIDRLFAALRDGVVDWGYDLNSDGLVDEG